MSISNDQAAFQKAQQYIQSGALPKAIKLLRGIKPQSPQYPHALYALGTVYMRSQNHEMAEQTFLQLLKLYPDHADSWRNLGLTRFYGLRRPLEAAEAFTKALDCGADPSKIKIYMGLISMHMNAPDKALALFDDAGIAYPHDPLLLNGKAQALLLLRKFHEAKLFILKFLEIEPSSVSAAYNALLLTEFLSDVDRTDVMAHLNRIQVAPEIALLLEAEKQEQDGDLQGALASYQKIKTEHNQLKTRVMYAIAKLHHRLGETDLAWKAYMRANQAERESPPSVYIDPQLYLAELTHLQEGATLDWAEAIHNLPKLKDKKDQPQLAFIIGFPRSGTTLTGSILNAHPDCLVTDELPALNKVIEHMVSDMGHAYPADLPNLSDKEREVLRQIYWGEHQKDQHWRPCQIFCDKFPLNLVHVGLIAALFPDAKLIYVQRHPADSVLSAFMQDFRPNAAMIHTYDVDDCARLYALVRAAYTAQEDVLKMDVHRVRYESLVTDFNAEVKACLEVLGLPWDDRVRDFSAQEGQGSTRTLTPSRKQVSKTLYTSAINRWKRYEKHMQTALKTLAPQIKALGYKVD